MADGLVISNGHVIDTANGIDHVTDVYIADGRIAELGQIAQLPSKDDHGAYDDTDSHGQCKIRDSPNRAIVEPECPAGLQQHSSTNSKTYSRQFDAHGCYVTGGLIDCHVHAYQYATPLGIDVDELCLSRGVTSVVDAGSAGVYNKMQQNNDTKIKEKTGFWKSVAKLQVGYEGQDTPIRL